MGKQVFMLGSESAAAVLLVLVVIGAVVVIFFVLRWAHLQAKKRLEALHRVATQLGLTLDQEKDADHDERFSQFAVFQRGDTRRAYNTMRGATSVGGAERQVLMGDFKFTTTSGSGKNRRRTTHHFSYLLVQLQHEVPELIIRRENFFDKIGAFFGFDDIDFESAEFSKRFSVKSSDKRFAWDLIDPRMMQWLMDNASPAIELEDNWMCMADGSRWAPEDYPGKIALADGFIDHWPDHTVQGLGEGRYGKGA